MGVLKVVLTVLFIIICIALVVLVLMQEGKSAGLGAISGAAETYWGKNKGRSMEGLLVKLTKGLAFLFMLLAVILNLNIYK
ncbi:preprotein translocase subunit SecG [Acetatifactor muris]|jgi:preprotein translocase subunit SecG|uniref:Protein-export membrane protein SecG n=1 Tax=Acetatifactor muris TaxID=879566 RepID=A0A2K4ZN42_9FIRM|nr:preprotein translocase subunit SecG [Acetatifactor muris]MCI8800425.1 preprotein translocase subunit SecG [Lachnospiraceae bacterium]MCR2050151.1 preprotein translocase subunit SecG [Acetatifactor muris]SOY31812.1 preprotein translocase subunit SecG [Acetatifactor muris]